MTAYKIKTLAKKYYKRVVEIRRKIHMYPELAFEEFKTAKLIAKELNSLNIEVKENIATTGLVGTIYGKYPGKTILIRADMDALPIQEETNLPYRSKHSGIMHACGHDGHVAGLLGVAMILNELRDKIDGNIKLVFQPAEEGQGGAKPMIEEGILNNPSVDAAIACHLWGDLPEGHIKILKGPVMAAPDVFTFKIIGKSGHAALPHTTIDPISLTVQAINNMQYIISRKLDPLKSAVISFCSIHGGDTYNIIPNEVEVKGTVRTFDESIRSWIPQAIDDILKGISISQSASYEFDYTRRFPPLINDDNMVDLSVQSLSKLIEPNKIITTGDPYMGGDDFAYFAEKIPSVYYFIGISKDINNPVIQHSSNFAWDDKNMILQMESLVQITLDFLENN